MHPSPYRIGERKGGSTGKILEGGSNGTAGITWDEDALMMPGKLSVGEP
jgi:hypothetical protein